MKRENAGSWNFGLEKEQVWEAYSAQLQNPWKSTWIFLGIYKKYWAEEVPEGRQQVATSLLGASTPWPRLGGLWAPPGARVALLRASIFDKSGKKIPIDFHGISSCAE